MAKKRASDKGSGGSKASKQTKLIFGQATAPAAAATVPEAVAAPAAVAAIPGACPRPGNEPAKVEAIMHDFRVLPVLSREAGHQLEQLVDEYKTAWAEKCTQLAASSSRGMPAREEVDLDATGLRFLEVCKLAFQQACREGAVLQRNTLEVLVLMLRNDALHKHPHVSRQAYSLLTSYLQQYPAVSLGRGADGKPYIITGIHRLPQFSHAAPDERNKHADNFWSSIEDNRDSFSRQYMMTADIAESGRNYKLAQAGEPAHRLRSTGRFSNPLSQSFDLLHHLFKAAAESDVLNRDGDLLLLRHLLAVLDQDLRCRLAVFSAYADAAEDARVQKQHTTLLQHSLLWRIYEHVDARSKLEMVKVLMQLISASSTAPLPAKAAGGSSEEEADVAPGDVEMATAAHECIFTKQQLGAMAGQFLRMLLEMFGAVELAKGFLATSSTRSASTNLRTQMDQHMIRCFWGEDSVCRNDKLSRTFLRSLPPRDRMRFLGMLIADKFKSTYDQQARGGLNEMLEAAHLLQNGGDAQRYVDVNMLQAVRAINLEHVRSIKVYSNINLLTVVVANIALTLHALAATSSDLLAQRKGGSSPLGGSMAELCKELHAALKGIVEKSLDPKDRTHHLADQSRMELVHAQMAITALA